MHDKATVKCDTVDGGKSNGNLFCDKSFGKYPTRLSRFEKHCETTSLRNHNKFNHKCIYLFIYLYNKLLQL